MPSHSIEDIKNRGARASLRLGVISAEAAGSKGSIRLVQVFEAGEDRRIFRFLVECKEPIDGSNISILERFGKRIDSPVLLLEVWHDDESCTWTSVLSVSMSAGVSFRIGAEPLGFLSIGKMLTRTFVEQRDCKMANPGNDALYEVFSERFLWHSDLRTLPHAVDAPQKPAQAEASKSPYFSIIIPLYQTPERFLRDALNAVMAQTFDDFELILVNASPDDESMRHVLSEYDDSRIKMIEMKENEGIVGNTNAGIRASRGLYLAFMDHDDVIEPTVLEQYAKVIATHPYADLLYCDEDSMSADGSSFFLPRFKPAINEGLIDSYNYICHMLMVSRWALDRVGLSDSDVEGAQDYDLSLKVLEVARDVVRVPHVLYHWRNHAGSTNGGVMDVKPYAIEAGAVALGNHLAREGIEGSVQPTDISCVYCTDVSNSPKEVIAVIIGTGAIDTAACMRAMESQIVEGDMHLKVAQADVGKANQDLASRINEIVANASESHVVIVRDTVRFPEDDPNALEHLLGCLSLPNAGIVAPKGFYADGLVQHAGLCVKDDGSFGFLNQNFTDHMGGGYLGFAESLCDYTAVGPGCMALTRDVFEQIGGFSEGYTDSVISAIDLCFKVRSQGLRVMVDPFSRVTDFAPVVFEGRSFPWSDSSNPELRHLWDSFDESFRRDVLSNPHVTFEDSYPQLKI